MSSKEQDDMRLMVVAFLWISVMLSVWCLAMRVFYKLDVINKSIDSIAVTEKEVVRETVKTVEIEKPVVVKSIEYRWRDREGDARPQEGTSNDLTENQPSETQNALEGLKMGSDGTLVGTYELTAYIDTGNACADGVYPQVGYTVACNDPALWHHWIYIEGVGERYVHDTGGMSSDVIDIYVGNMDDAIQFGRQSAAVYIID